MDLLKRLDPLWIALLIIGGLNWAVLALFDTNVVSEIFGTGTVTDAIYVLVGVAALMFVPRLLEGMHLPGRHSHPRRIAVTLPAAQARGRGRSFALSPITRYAWNIRHVARIAGGQHGRITWEQLLAGGLEPRARSSVGWPTVACTASTTASTRSGHPGRSIDGDYMAAVLACGDGAVAQLRAPATYKLRLLPGAAAARRR